MSKSDKMNPMSPLKYSRSVLATLFGCRGKNRLLLMPEAYSMPGQRPLRVFRLGLSQAFCKQCSSIVGLTTFENGEGREVEVCSCSFSKPVSSRGKTLL